MDAANFRDIMGFSAGQEVLYEDDATDETIPDIQKLTKRNNTLPIHGSDTTMNLNHLVLENIIQSTYYKNFLCDVTTFQQIVEEVHYNVSHLEPWERGTRKLHGTGMCGGVRGVGAGGVISTAFCVLYKMFTLRLTRKQLVSMINSTHSVYLRGIGFIYIRFCQPPADLWAWLSPYLDDEEEIDPKSGGGDSMKIGDMLKMMLTKLDWYGTLFPRIPIPIQKDIDQKLNESKRSYSNSTNSWKDDWNGFKREEKKSHDDHNNPKSHFWHEPRRKRCPHHLRHHHCRKHRKICPTKAKKEKLEKVVSKKDE